MNDTPNPEMTDRVRLLDDMATKLEDEMYGIAYASYQNTLKNMTFVDEQIASTWNPFKKHRLRQARGYFELALRSDMQLMEKMINRQTGPDTSL